MRTTAQGELPSRDTRWFAHGIEQIHETPVPEALLDNGGALRPAMADAVGVLDGELDPPGLLAHVLNELAPRSQDMLWEPHRFVQALHEACHRLRVEGRDAAASRQACAVVERALQMHDMFEQRFYALRQG